MSIIFHMSPSELYSLIGGYVTSVTMEEYFFKNVWTVSEMNMIIFAKIPLQGN